MARAKKTDQTAFVLDIATLQATGQEMAIAASQQTIASGTFWDRCRTHFVDANNHGQGQAALEALFSAGDKVKGKKAPWYRTYKSILSAALRLGVKVDNSHGMTAVQKLVKEAKEEAVENDPKARKAKAEEMKVMFKRMAQGCINAGVTKAQLAAILREVE